MRRLAAITALVALALTACGTATAPSSGTQAPPQPTSTAAPTTPAASPTATHAIDRECYRNFVAPDTLGPAIAAPSDQPWVQSPWDCRYTETKAADATITGDLDPQGCYGLDPGGGTLVPREDFCPSVPAMGS
jgi:hypothetical protein